MRWLLSILAFIHLYSGPIDEIRPSTPDEIASLSADLLVDGFVSALSGQISLTETDLHVRGTQDLLFKRIYIPPQILGRYENKDEADRWYLGVALLQLHTKGWIALPHLWAGYNPNSPYFQLRDPQGYVLEFLIDGNRGILKTASFGCSNLRREEPNSSADIRNIELWMENNQVRVIWPDGTERIYQNIVHGLYRLDHELLPNGKRIQYQWGAQGLGSIASTDPIGKYIYASIDRIENNHYRGSDGNEVQLNYEPRDIKGKIKREKGKERGTFNFSVLTRGSNPYYSNTASYNERTLLTSYDAKVYPISCSYYQNQGEVCRIQTFSTPTGSSSFAYDPPIAGQKGGSTTVTHEAGSQTIYRFDARLLLVSLENWLEGKLYNQKTFTYDHKQHLAKVETKDGSGNVLLTKTYDCDGAGNPTLETHKGDFGIFSIRRTFSKNRVISEERDDGLSYEYTYLKKTRLLTSEVTLMNGQPIRKILYFYDESDNLIEKQEEGQTITRYKLYQNGPNLHRVEWEEKEEWNGKLIHKARYSYDRYGNISQEDHYGSDGKFAYTIERGYDNKGNLLYGTNPIGQKATYTYDARSRLIQEIPFSQKITLDRTLDAKGRLISLKEGDHVTTFTHDASDDMIQKTDYLGLKTDYTYHPVHHRPILIKEGPTLLEINYDPFAREVMRKDAYGATWQTKPNSYGDPLEILHPDGGKETFSYASNGLLTLHKDPDGLMTYFSYDPLGRVLSQKVGNYETTYTYDPYHLIEEKDPLGISIFYDYNLNHQKVRETRAGMTTEFSYDPLGYLAFESKSDRKITYNNDLIGRVLEKNIDGFLKTTYTYDSGGNTESISKGDPIYFSYDPYDRLIEKMDAEGNRTTIAYTEGALLLIKTIKDPRGVETIETYNAHGLLLKREIPDSFLEEFAYDKALRLASQDHLTFTYTPEGFRAFMCEAGQRTTYWTYTPGGKISSKQKPDGTVISYEYNSQGELVKMGSREFTYDGLGRLIQGSGFSRELDAFGNILTEEFGNGLSLKTEYDAWNRPICRVLPDQSQIAYQYEGPFLNTVTRISANGSILYAHTYEEFDAKGKPHKETGLFSSFYQYDKSGRRTFQKNPYFEEELCYDATGNLIQKGNTQYVYDDASQLISETKKFSREYDQHYNCIQENGMEISIDQLNQRRDITYDLNGNLQRPGFIYDEFNQLISHGNIYDALGRRLSSGSVAYFYINNEEIGSVENGQIQELKVPGYIAPVAIEIDSKSFAPIVDAQNTICQLITWDTRKVAFENNCDAFGNGLTDAIPYAYVGKRYDASTGLVYFGKRFYDPSLRRWLTQDPLGPTDHSNLYQYVFNNPYRFQDPSGESIGGYLLGCGEIVLGATIMVLGGVVEVGSFGTLTVGVVFAEASGAALIGHGLSMTTYHAQEIKTPNVSWINTNVYAPQWKEATKKPPRFNGKDLGSDPSQCPGEGFEWRGKGSPESGKGNWLNPDTGEKLHPDLWHPDPKGPHWGYKDSDGIPYDLFPNGSWQ